MDRPITYEIAKKLKELGYKGRCDQYYGAVVDRVIQYCQDHNCDAKEALEHKIGLHRALSYDEPFFTAQVGDFINKKYRTGDQVFVCTAPTIAQVKNWILKRYNIAIVAEPIVRPVSKSSNKKVIKWVAGYCDITNGYQLVKVGSKVKQYTSERVALMAVISQILLGK